MNSPCTKVCVMDADNRYCLGCKRTLGEIARWGEMADSERARVLELLPARDGRTIMVDGGTVLP